MAHSSRNSARQAPGQFARFRSPRTAQALRSAPGGCAAVCRWFTTSREVTAGPNCLVRSTDFTYNEPSSLNDPQTCGYTLLREASHRSYQRRPIQLPPSSGYEWRELPPVAFTYSRPEVDSTIRSIAAQDLPNLPVGTQGPGYQWVDLDGEGLSGVLTEQAGAWHYAANRGGGRFGPSRVVAQLPATALVAGGRQQLMDLAGDGEIDLVDFSGPTPGFHERDRDQGWKRHVPFASLPNIDWQDSNLRFVDLTGDGHADALITEHDVFTWYPSLDERGFGQAHRQHQAIDEDAAARVVFNDGTQTIFLADMCGDGLTDLVRIRNGRSVTGPTWVTGASAARSRWPTHRASMRRTSSTRNASAWPTSTAAAPLTSSTSDAKAHSCTSTAAATASAMPCPCRSPWRPRTWAQCKWPI